MYKTILKIDGMHCGMCESYINDLVRKTVEAKKVTSSHSKGETVILSDGEIDVNAVREAISAHGYKVLTADSQPYEKKGLFGRK